MGFDGETQVLEKDQENDTFLSQGSRSIMVVILNCFIMLGTFQMLILIQLNCLSQQFIIRLKIFQQPSAMQVFPLLLSLFVGIVFSNQDDYYYEDFEHEPVPSMNQKVRQREYKARDQNRMNYQNIESYTIKARGIDSFYLEPQVDQEVKCELYVYWKEGNIFISSEYRAGEQVRVMVFEDQQRIVYDKPFYMVYGFSFNVKKGSTYQIRFITAGKISKLISLTVSRLANAGGDLVDNEVLSKTEERIGKMRGQIQAFFSISERNYMIEKKLTDQVLSSTNIYMFYEVLEIVIVVAITVMQTVFVTRVLSSSSIV